MSRSWKLISRLFICLFLIISSLSLFSFSNYEEREYYTWRISNKLLNSINDTVLIYPKRWYNDIRTQYYKDSTINGLFSWLFYKRNGEHFFTMTPYKEGAVSRQWRNIIENIDYYKKEACYYRFDTDLKRIYFSSSDEQDNKSCLCEDSVINCPYYDTLLKQYKAYSNPSQVFRNCNYFIAMSSHNFMYSLIYFKGKRTDSIKNSVYDFRNGRILPSRLTSNLLLRNDTLFGCTYPKHCFDSTFTYLKFIEFFYIYEGIAHSLTDSNSISKYFETKQIMITNRVRYSSILRLVDVVDSTLILWNEGTKQYYYYDYINKKFFDPVIKIIDD